MSDIPTALTSRVARWSIRRPWLALGSWLAAIAIAVGLAVLIPTVTTTDADYRTGESGRADAWLHAANLESPTSEMLLVRSRDRTAVPTSVVSAGVAALKQVDGVKSVDQPVYSADRRAVLLSVHPALDGHVNEGQLSVVARRFGARVTGDNSLDDAVNARVGRDLKTAERLSLPITLVVMLIAFGALVAAGLPVLLAAGNVAATIGVMAPLAHLVPAEPTVSSMIVLIGMAVGVDYSLFYLRRCRQARLAGASTVDAVEIAAATSGHSVLVSGFAVISAMLGMFLMADATFTSLAIGSILVVAVAVAGSLTVLPAMLVLLGDKVGRVRRPRQGRISRAVIGAVTGRPVLALVAGTLVMVALALPGTTLRTHTADLDSLPGSVPQVQTMRDIAATFPSSWTQVDVVAQSTGAGRAQLVATLAKVRGRGRGDISVSADGRTAVLRLSAPNAKGAAARTVDRLRQHTVPHAFAGVRSRTAVGGEAAFELDRAHHLSQRLPLLLGFVLGATFLTMLLAFRSLRLAMWSTVLNVLSVAAALGVLVLVMQDGWGENLLGFRSPGFVIDWVPVFVIVVLVGLSMDYHVFVVGRIRENALAGVPLRDAVQGGVVETAGTVASAAAVMIAVFSLFAGLSMLEMKSIGIGLAAAVLLDATVVRFVLLPAGLLLLGPSSLGRAVNTPAGEDDRAARLPAGGVVG